MLNRTLSLAMFMLLSLAAFAQRNSNNTTLSTTNISATQEAKNFGLSLVKAYFDNNCPFVYGKLANEITAWESGEKIQKSSFTAQQFCAENPIRTDIRSNYTIYQKSYTQEVLDHTQFAAKYPSIQEKLQLKAGDFFFNGAVLNSGATDIFRASDMVRFILRRTGANQFEIICM